VCLLGRYLEENGIPTLIVGGARDILRAGRPPRALFCNYPLGHTTGKPEDKDDQLRILRAALAAFEAMSAPESLLELPAEWSREPAWEAAAQNEAAGDQRSPRDTETRYQCEEDRLLAEARLAARG
jgi:hypothetical protein